MSHYGSGLTVPEGPIPLQDADVFDKRRGEEQPSEDIYMRKM